jgi:histidyl-tRNA synthetase
MALAVRAAEAMRAAGVSAQLEVLRRPVGKALKGADEAHLRWAVIVGSEEAARGEVALKDLVSGEQRKVAIDALAAAVGK